MKKSSLLDYYLYLTVKILSFLVKFIPIELSLILAGFIGRMAYYLFRKKRDLACKNLKIAFEQYSSLEVKQIVKKTFIHTLQHLVEILYLPWMDEKYIKKYIGFEGVEEVKELILNKKGVIFLALHLGSWEVGNVVLAQVFADYNYIGLARTQTKTPLFDELINSFRQKRNCRIVKVSDSFRPLIEHLKKGYALAMVADHGAQGGEVVDFLGRDALTPSGGLKLALKLDTNVVIGFFKRIKGPYHKLIMRPYVLMRAQDESSDLKINMERVNYLYGQYIKEGPEQYLWFFKRWKHSPQRNILILSDGKAGHLRQSQAVAELVGGLGFQVKLDILEMKFRNKATR